MEWELSKENVQPLKEGRNVEKLNASLEARVVGPSKNEVSEKHREMVEAIDIYDGDDPLQPWIECIKWVKEAYPSGGSQSKLLQLLELCVRTFSKDLTYKDDLRYLKVWMDYADHCTNPREIYAFLQDNNIGQQYALFYEHCGRFWEQQQKFLQAKDIYDLGIARKAQPLESLKAAYKRFLQRASRESSKDEAQSVPPLQSTRAFGSHLAGRKKGLPLQSTQERNGFSSERRMSSHLSVYVDPEMSSISSLSSPQGSKFIPEMERNKENIQRASKWAGIKVGGAMGIVAAPEFKLDVFQDEDETTQRKKVENHAEKHGQTSRVLRLDDINSSSSEEDRLKQKPLVYFEEDNFFL